jgi:hypothetical protein
MATPYTNINDLFMMQLTDYRLVNLFNASETDFNVYLQGFMLLSLTDFYNCNQDLNDRSDAAQTFNFDMNQDNQNILSKLMITHWLGKEVRDILQMRWSVTDRDFKHYAEANNLREKQNSLNVLREECDQLLKNYSLRNNDWSAWASQNFVV